MVEASRRHYLPSMINEKFAYKMLLMDIRYKRKGIKGPLDPLGNQEGIKCGVDPLGKPRGNKGGLDPLGKPRGN